MKKVKLKFMKLFAILSATFIGAGALKPCEAVKTPPLEIQTELADLYCNYQIKKFKATTPSENYQASMEFFTEFKNLRNIYHKDIFHCLSLFCENDIPAHIKNHWQIAPTLSHLSINELSGRIMVNIALLSGITYSFEL